MADCAAMAVVSTSAIEVREVTVERLLSEGRLLFKRHWEEVAENSHIKHFKLHELRLKALEAAETLFIVGAYSGDTLVGYSVALLIAGHLHDEDLFYCASDAIFVDEPFRNSGIGATLMRTTERMAKASGATLMQWHTMCGSDFDESLAKSTHYLPQDVIYTREL